MNGVAYEFQEDPLLEVGKTYLFFMNLPDEGILYAGPPYGRFEVLPDGTLSVVSAQWSRLGAVKELNGRRLTDVAPELRQLAKDVASGKVKPAPYPTPLPTQPFPTPIPFRTATPTPSVLPSIPAGPPQFPTRPPLPSPAP